MQNLFISSTNSLFSFSTCTFGSANISIFSYYVFFLNNCIQQNELSLRERWLFSFSQKKSYHILKRRKIVIYFKRTSVYSIIETFFFSSFIWISFKMSIQEREYIFSFFCCFFSPSLTNHIINQSVPSIFFTNDTCHK